MNAAAEDTGHALAQREASMPSAFDARGVYRPQSISDTMKYAEILSDSSFIPKGYQGKPGDIVAAMQMGAAVGLAPLQALNGIAVINGRPSVWGDTALAIVMAHPAFESIDEQRDGEKATCRIVRRQRGADGKVRLRETVRAFTLSDAKKAGLLGKAGPWAQYPDRMLQMRARSFAMRDTFPDALGGLFFREEAIDVPGEAVEVEYVRDVEDVPTVRAQQPPPTKGVGAVRDKIGSKGKPKGKPEPEAPAASGVHLDAEEWIQAIERCDTPDDLEAIDRDLREIADEAQPGFLSAVSAAVTRARDGFRKL